ncbi:MAG: histidine kinase [Bacteroidota bacterium]
MKRKSDVSRRKVGEFVVWTLYVGFDYLISTVEHFGRNAFQWTLNLFLHYSFAIGFFYLCFHLVVPFFLKDRKRRAWIVVVTLFAHNTVRFMIYSESSRLLGDRFPYPYNYWQAFSSGSWVWMQYSVYAFIYYLGIRAIDFERNLRLTKELNSFLEQKNHNLQTENLKLEYKFLRAQINPHFLYNVLAFFYSKVRNQDENAGRGIMLLTEMMRYSIREPDADDKVLLQEEIQAISNLLELQKLRFEGNSHAEIYIGQGVGHLRIVPHVLVTLVENACKHGNLTDKGDPLKITAEIQDGWFVFTTVNKVRSARMVEYSDGFGLENLATRIKLQYEDNQYFDYGNHNDYYRVTFKLRESIMVETEAERQLKTQKKIEQGIIQTPTQWLPA